MRRRRASRRLAPAGLVVLPLLAPGPAAAQLARNGDHIDITAVTVEGASAQECNQRTARAAQQSRALSLATSPPYDLSDGLRTFYDHVLRLDANGELSSIAQLSSVHVAGYDAAGGPLLRAVTPFVRVEVSRPPGTPADAPSHIVLSWLWLRRIEQARDAAGRPVEQPQLHRFDFAGEVMTTYDVWGQATAPCQRAADGRWFGGVAVWTYLPP